MLYEESFVFLSLELSFYVNCELRMSLSSKSTCVTVERRSKDSDIPVAEQRLLRPDISNRDFKKRKKEVVIGVPWWSSG